MTTPMDIRDWADSEGIDIGTERPILQDNDGTLYKEVPDEAEGSKVEEIPPKIPTPSIADQASEAVRRVRELPDKFNPLKRHRGGSTPSQARATRTKRARPRVPVDSIISTVWHMAAKMVQPVAWPVANVLKVQAPVAGMVLEDVVKNTAIDKVLQPLARVGTGGEIVFALVAPPVLVGLVSAKPETQNVVLPILRQALVSWIKIAGPKMEEIAQQEKEFEEKYGSSVDAMIQLFFTPPPGMEVPEDIRPEV